MSAFVDHPQRLLWLLLPLFCAGVVLYGFAMKRRAMRAFAAETLLGFLTPNVSRRRQVLRAILVLTAMLALVAACLGPRWGVYYEEVQQRRIDLVICLDVSRSMLVEDAGMSRLDRAKDDIKRLLNRLSGGMVGIVVFAGRADVLCPLTDDYAFVRLALDDIGIQSAGMGGTNLAAAIETGAKAFAGLGPQRRVLILVTDGEDHQGGGEAAATAAHERGIDVHCIGLGDYRQGGLIPVEKEGQKSFLMYEGRQLWSKQDPATLEAIARAGGGLYRPSEQVSGTQRTLEWLYASRLAPLEKRSPEKRKVERKHARFHWFAALGLALLLLEPLISERKGTRRLS